jgi:D-alanyl-D-alanine carboxypeptidase
MRLFLTVLALPLLVIGAGVSFPDTPAGRQFAAWLKVFNAADKDGLEKFAGRFAERRSTVQQELEFREQTGGFDPVRVEDSSPTALTLLVKERESGRYARLTLEVEAAEPHRILKVGGRIVPRPDGVPAPARLSEPEAVKALSAELDRQAAADRFSGAVLVAKNGNPVLRAAFGMADRERKTANQVNTQFRIGSMNKMFTAVAVMQLVQQGKLRLSDPVGKHLPDYPNRDVAAKVTVHHLLTHTGGTGDIFGPEFAKRRLELKELDDYVKLYGQRAPEFEPGGQHRYSNYGFLLLGVLVTKVSGQSYYDYVREHIFKPAGMTRTDSLPESEAVAGRSTGYMRRGGQFQPNDATLPYRGTPAGGGYSTVEDLVRFAHALTAHKLLSAKYTRLLTTGKVAAPPGQYAYGFMDANRAPARWFGHGGGAPGMNGDLRIYPDSGYVVAVLSNLDPPAAQRISDFVDDRFPLTQ